MKSYTDTWSPKIAILIWRIFAILVLAVLWFKGNAGTEGFALVFVLAILSLARWRFILPAWTTLVDQILCMTIIPFWPEASFGLVLPLFETMLAGKPLFSLPILAALVLGYIHLDFPLLLMFLQASFAGWIVLYWSKQIHYYRLEADQERREKYELEMLKSELLMANVQTAQLAELKERHRISQKLHDEVGHELTAAILALQAFETLWKENDPQAKDMFAQAQIRLSNSAMELRETVYNMQPVQATGIRNLEEICRNFKALPVQLQIYGDTSRIAAHLWVILNSCLKEALTNAVRHSKAEHVEVSLDVSEHIVRLSVQNDGVLDSSKLPGTGLRNLRQRTQAVGGSISTNTSNGFQLICVLPMGKEGIR
ncbi:histidine kinase [Neobacillus mesonae]|nr:histidine kinase [Neobacillus mesonae]